MAESPHKGMLLVIEKDPRFTEKFKKHLKVGDLRPFFVESGKDALFLLDSMQASFLLINLNGIRSWEELNDLMTYSREHRVPYLFVEGLRKTQAIADRLRSKGYKSFIKLPFSVKTLTGRMTRMLNADNMLGKKLGPEGHRVELISKLGSGATGQVYQARQRSLDRQVAVKFLAPEHVTDKEAQERFFREARAIAQMKSAHIVQVYFVGNHEGQPYLVMEYINGPTLEKYLLSKGTLKPARALKITREILMGLVEAHHNDKVHRDLKPANVMLNRKGHAVILDFGLVRERTGNLTQQGMVMGTPRYISPEQVQGHQIDGRCDLYSLGIMLYEMLIGDVPFKGKDFVSVLWKHVKTPMPKPQDLGKHIDPGLWKIVEKLTAKKPENRYRNAEKALRDVENYLENLSMGGLTSSPSDTRELLAQVHPLGGIAVNGAGDLTHKFGDMPQDRARILHVTNGLVNQLQGLMELGSFHRGLVTLNNEPNSQKTKKLMVFHCYDGLAGIETDDSEVTTKFNMMDTAELGVLFQGEFER